MTTILADINPKQHRKYSESILPLWSVRDQLMLKNPAASKLDQRNPILNLQCLTNWLPDWLQTFIYLLTLAIWILFKEKRKLFLRSSEMASM